MSLDIRKVDVVKMKRKEKALLTELEVAERLAEYQRDGYESGYTWLTRGKNFRHPNAGGYIPGGPFVASARQYDRAWYKQEAKITALGNQIWRNAWVDGINQYVADNNLEYPVVERLYQ